MSKQRPFAVFDIDGTLIRWQLYHAIADALAHLGFMDPEAHSYIKRARMDWKRRVEGRTFRDYELEVIAAYEAALTKLSKHEVSRAIDMVFEEYKDQVYSYTRGLLKDLKSRDYVMFAISGSQSEIVSKIAQHYGFDDFVGTVYEQRDNRFTGKKTIGSLNKDATLKNLIRKHQVALAGSVGVGDSHSDVAMLKLVETPLAFNPDADLFSHASAHGWKIVIERKNVIYQLENKNGSYVLA